MDESIKQPQFPAGLGWWTIGFCAVYIAIHVLLNLTGGGSHQLFIPPIENLIVEISGPFTIGIATSILILTFGMFLHNGARDIAIAYPQGINKSFIIFVVGVIVIQCAGHAQIYVNECGRSGVYDQLPSLFSDAKDRQIIGRFIETMPLDCTPSIFWNAIAVLTYLMVLFCIGLLEHFHEEIYHRLKDQIPDGSKRIMTSIAHNAWIGGWSIIITLSKTVIIFFSYNISPGYLAGKAMLSAFAIFLELVLFVLIFSNHYKSFKGEEKVNS